MLQTFRRIWNYVSVDQKTLNKRSGIEHGLKDWVEFGPWIWRKVVK